MTSILAIPGALRRASMNRGLARAAAEVAPDGIAVTVHGLDDIPLYDGDVEAAGIPQAVLALRDAIAAADAVLLCTPEYNSSIPGVLKNALDWMSRPPRPIPLDGLPVALCGASPGGFGTVRSQTHHRQVLQFTGALVMPKPELYVSRATGLFDESGDLQDEDTRAKLADLLTALAAWTDRLGAA